MPLRGDWDKCRKAEDGNFAFFVTWKSKFDKELNDHVHNAPENAKYTSPSIQNEIISLCEKSIRGKILSSIPQYWSILADETQDISTCEQVSLCIRFVSHNLDVCEEFVGFVKISKMDATSIAGAIVSTLQKWGLDMSCLVGQGYDGASVMSSSKDCSYLPKCNIRSLQITCSKPCHF